MKIFACAAVLAAASATGLFGQQWEFGAFGGAGFLSNVNVSSPIGSATAGFQPGMVAGGFFGQNMYAHWSGEIRYEYMRNDLHIQAGGTNAVFAGDAHLLHYDMVWHTNRRESRTQAFVAVGAGMKYFRGLGTEEAYQPNYQYGYLTRTNQFKPMGDIGAGIRYQLKPRLYLRAEFRDFITPFPSQLIAPAPGTKYGSILQDFVPMVGISYEN